MKPFIATILGIGLLGFGAGCDQAPPPAAPPPAPPPAPSAGGGHHHECARYIQEKCVGQQVSTPGVRRRIEQHPDSHAHQGCCRDDEGFAMAPPRGDPIAEMCHDHSREKPK